MCRYVDDVLCYVSGQYFTHIIRLGGEVTGGPMERDRSTGARERHGHDIRTLMRGCSMMPPSPPKIKPHPPLISHSRRLESFSLPQAVGRGVCGEGRRWQRVQTDMGRGCCWERSPSTSEPHSSQLCYMSNRGRCGPTRSLARSLSHTALVMMMSLWEPASPPPTSGVMLFRSR